MQSMTDFVATSEPAPVYTAAALVAPLIQNNSTEFLQCHIGTSPPPANTKNFFALLPREREDIPVMAVGQKLYVWCLTGSANFVLIIPEA